MKPYLLLALWSTLLLAAESSAAPAAKDSKTLIQPTVTVQVKSIDELLSSLKTTVKTFFPEKLSKEFEQEVLTQLDPNKIKGVATNKPFGLYAVIGEGLPQQDFSKSSAVALIPIADEKAFLELFDQSNLRLEKNGDAYSFPIPNAPIKGSLRFLKGYAYIIAAPEDFDPKTLLDPKELFDNSEKAALALRVRADRLPNDLKKAASDLMSQFGVMVTNCLFGLGGQEMLLLLMIPMMVAAEEDVKEFVYRLDLDAKTGIFAYEIAIEPKKGTRMARSISGLPRTRNEFAGMIGGDSAAQFLVQTPLFAAEVKDFLCKGSDRLAKLAGETIANDVASKKFQAAATEGFKALRRTMEEGTLDLAVSLRGPDKNGQYTAIGALNLRDSADLEKSLKALALTPVFPKEIRDLIELDAFKVNGANVHQFALGEMLPAEAQKVFGKSSAYVAFAPKALFITFGAEGKSIITDALAGKLNPKPAPLLQAEISSKRLIPLFKTLGAAPDGDAIGFFEYLAKTDRQPLLALKVDGGERLMLRWELGLPALYAMMPKAKNAKP